ncbi:MAG: hypothetical protein Q7R89_00135 [bacterium]|nr:hypothetical protein [bacterium]
MTKEHEGWKVEKLKVSDDKTMSWIETFKKAGFSEDEIDLVMKHLNDEYAKQKVGNWVEPYMEEMLKKITKEGLTVNEEQKDALRSVLFEQMRKMSSKQLESDLKEFKETEE